MNDLIKTHYELYQDAKSKPNVARFTIKQLEEMGRYGISNIIQIPFPYTQRTFGCDRDWIVVALQCEKRAPDLFNEEYHVGRTLEVFVLSQRLEGSTFYRVMKVVDGKNFQGGWQSVPEKVDLDLDRYPYQTEAGIFGWMHCCTEVDNCTAVFEFPVSWRESIRLEMDYCDKIRQNERVRVYYANQELGYKSHAVAEALAEGPLEASRDSKCLVAEMQPFTYIPCPVAGEMSTSNQPSRDSRHFWHLMYPDGLRSPEKWLIPESTWGGFSWKETHQEEAIREGWTKLIEEGEVGLVVKEGVQR